ncbi:MAG: patatin-like phospholipase family protein [Deltaproteobacteria bacterium]|nr:patatin-like phospholipase family protein [Deltaproteobacteria bacterium]MBW2361628.1 patatin-like phospholipase family protein [Deltaproteobacteria bacterium]
MSATTPGNRPRRAVVFSGGGARGAYEAGFVRYLCDELPEKLGRAPKIDILCGTSVGAIHACFMAGTAHQGPGRGERLVDVWKAMRLTEILPFSARDLLALPRRILGVRRVAEAMKGGELPDRLYGLFNTEALEQVVLGAIPWREIRNNVREGLVDAVCVPATQIGTGRVVVFMETRDRTVPHWTRDPSIVPRPTRLLPTHAMASAAIPLLFPAVRVASTYYADGGLRLNTPLAPALRLGADRVLVVSLRQATRQTTDAAMSERRIADYGSPTFLFGKVLNALMLDHLDTDLARMHVLNEFIRHGEQAYGEGFIDTINEIAVREHGQAYRPIRDIVIRPSADLGQLAGEILANLSDASSRSPIIRLAARNISDNGRTPESDLLSYLLFDGEFLSPLADLGLRDARAREDELIEFFTD